MLLMRISLDDLEHFFPVIAIISAGMWAAFHAWKKRLYVERLHHSVACCVQQSGHIQLLIVTATVTNPGASHIELDPRGTALALAKATLFPKNAILPLSFGELSAVEVLADHRSIESKEVITEQHVFHAPTDGVYRIEFSVATKASSYTTQCIVVVNSVE